MTEKQALTRTIKDKLIPVVDFLMEEDYGRAYDRFNSLCALCDLHVNNCNKCVMATIGHYCGRKNGYYIRLLKDLSHSSFMIPKRKHLIPRLLGLIWELEDLATFYSANLELKRRI